MIISSIRGLDSIRLVVGIQTTFVMCLKCGAVDCSSQDAEGLSKFFFF